MAEHFNAYFTNIGPTLDNKIRRTSTNPISYIKTCCIHNIHLSPCTDLEIGKIIENLKNCASGWDNLPAQVLKENKPTLTPLLTHIVNLSLTQRVFPKQLKVATIIPVFSSGPAGEVGKYRPISLLTAISKNCDRIFCTRLSSFLTKYKILYNIQFGFRPNHSTQPVIITLLKQIISYLDKGYFTIGIYLDFSKAFDTVNHQILLNKLECYGIRGLANKWITSYLADRQQLTIYNNGKHSNISQIKCGVPQGSILGPILFLIYINDLGTISNKISTIMFADDSNIFASEPNLKNIETVLNSEIPVLIDWLRANRLSLNVDKRHTMIFGPTRKSKPHKANIQIEGRTLDIVNSTKFLGVILDSSLNWKNHILQLTKKIAKSIGIISLARPTVNQKTLIQLYYSFIFPYLTYCTIIWGKSANTSIWPVYRLQKITIRLIGNIPRRYSSKAFCKQQQILRFPKIYVHSVSIFMFKFMNSLLPTTFNKLYRSNRAFHNYPTRNSQQLRPPRTRTKLADNFIANQGVKIWNEISTKFDVITSLPVFKHNIKRHLLSSY